MQENEAEPAGVISARRPLTSDGGGHQLPEGSGRKVTDVRRKDALCTVFQGDCLEVMATLADCSVHAVLTDHPYGSTDCHWDQRVNLAAWWQQVDRVTTETAVVVCFAAQPFATDLINSNRRAFRYELVWDKLQPVGFLNANRQPLRIHELLLIFCRRPGKSIYQPQFSPGKPYVSHAKANRTSIYSSHGAKTVINPGRRHPTSILRFSKPGRGRIHPTEKPEPLLAWMVNSYTRPGSVVLDPFMGSASTGEAAIRRGRRFIGIERDPEFFAAGSARLERVAHDVRRRQT